MAPVTVLAESRYSRKERITIHVKREDGEYRPQVEFPKKSVDDSNVFDINLLISN